MTHSQQTQLSQPAVELDIALSSTTDAVHWLPIAEPEPLTHPAAHFASTQIGQVS